MSRTSLGEGEDLEVPKWVAKVRPHLVGMGVLVRDIVMAARPLIGLVVCIHFASVATRAWH
jgi:hypothetical protein